MSEFDNEAFELVLEVERPPAAPVLVDDPPAAVERVVDELDVLCEGCRERIADGRLSGTPLCVDCADEAVEHWLAWLVNPFHEWWPGDNPFGSARYVPAGWRELDR